MRVSSSLSLKALTSRIHPQLPLNARESDKLLNLLTSSFRKQLDKVHPVEQSSSTDGLITRSSSRTSSSSQYTATKHLDSILANPLFAVKPSTSTFEKTTLGSNEERLRPVVDFKDRVASGYATLSDALRFMRLIENGVKPGHAKDVISAIVSARSGSIVLEWLQSSCLISSPTFLRDEHVIHHLTRHLIDEGRYGAVKDTLFDMPLAANDGEKGLSLGEKLQYKARIVRQVCQSSIAIGGVNLMVARFLDMVLTDRHRDGSQFSSKTYEPVGYAVVMTVLDSRKTVSHKMYGKLLRYLPLYDNCSGLLNASLKLYSPTQPDHAAALSLLKAYHSGEQALPLVSGTNSQTPRSQVKARKVIVDMCLETATMLVERRNIGDAKWVVEFARKHFAEELGSQDQHELVEVDKAVHSLQHVDDTKYERNGARFAFG